MQSTSRSTKHQTFGNMARRFCLCHNISGMARITEHIQIQLGPQGRVVIPAALRRTLGLESGDTLVVYLEEGRLVLEKPEVIKRRLKARFKGLPAEKSLAAELLAERREEASREQSS